MRTTWMTAAAVALGAGSAMAQEGNADAGEQVFNQCQACHVVTDDDGNTLAGRAGRTGPNLYGLPGRVAGTVEDFRYSSSMQEAGEAGLAWNQEDFVAYVQDPTGFLKEHLGDDGARGKMVFQLRDEEDAANVWAYLVSLSEEGAGDGPGERSGGEGG